MKISIGNYPKDSKKQRKISVKIDPWDTWSMDHTLAYIIHPMLVQLHETNNGAPMTDDEDVPEKLRSTSAPPKKNEWDVDKNYFKRWNWIMQEMIWAFNEIKLDRDPQFWIQKPKYKRKKIDKEQTEDRFTFRDEEKYRAYYTRRKNALRLFGKYYENLWD